MPRSRQQKIVDGPTDEIWEAPLPPAVQRQVERANELIANPEASANPAQSQSEAEGSAAAPEGMPSGEASSLESTPLPSEAAPAAPPDWEQRFNTLQGKYNSEIRDLQSELRVLRDMQNYDRRPPPEQIPPPNYQYQTYQPAPAAEIPAEDVESFGQELITASQRWAAAAYQPVISQLEQRLRNVEQGNQNLNVMNVTARCEHELDGLVPGWRTVNTDQNFLNWLSQIDPFSGRSRQAMINEAYGAGDANRTALFFRAFQAEHTAVTPAPTGTLQARQEETPAASQPLLDLVAPGRAQTAPLQAPGAPTKRIWTRDDIAAFYRAKQRGFWRGREGEGDRIEQDLMTAQQEGRIR